VKLFKFIKKIDPECEDFQQISKRACKIDGDSGIKKYLGLDLSSCDYFYMKKQDQLNIIKIIEFTDLKRQKEDLEKSKKLNILDIGKILETVDELKIENCKDEIKGLLKPLRDSEIKRMILDELRKKAVESIIIFYKLEDKFNIKECNLKNLKFHFNVVTM